MQLFAPYAARATDRPEINRRSTGYHERHTKDTRQCPPLTLGAGNELRRQRDQPEIMTSRQRPKTQDKGAPLTLGACRG